MLPDSIKRTLQAAVEHRDKHDPVVFAGRDDELQFLHGLIQVIVREGADPRSALRVVQGPPGTGKTALCEQFMTNLRNQAANAVNAEVAVDAPQVVCATITAADLGRPPLSLASLITRSLVDGLSGALRNFMSAERKALLGQSLEDLRDLVSQRWFRGKTWEELQAAGHGLDQHSELWECIATFAEKVWPEGATVALCLDEAQNCDPNNENAVKNLSGLCEGQHRAPLALLCFGLPNTSDVLRRMQISRPPDDYERSLGCLLPGQGAQVIDRTLDAWGMSNGNPAWAEHVQSLGMTAREWDGWRAHLVEGLAESAGEFPQHIAVALASMADAVLGMGEGQCFDDALDDAIRKQHQERKSAYYLHILKDDRLHGHQMALGAVCELIRRMDARGGFVERDAAMSLLAVADDYGRSVADGCAVLDAAVAKGVLGEANMTLDDDAVIEIVNAPPIQSMQTHLRRKLQYGMNKSKPAAASLLRKVDDMVPPDDAYCGDGDGSGLRP